MFIFIDAISPMAKLVLFDDKKIISQKSVDILMKEYDRFLIFMTEFLEENNIKIDNLKGISVINGPGGFTGTRIISLTINTISFTKNIPVDALDYFILLEKSGLEYPMLIKANRSEYLIKKTKDSLPEIINIVDIPDGRYSGIGNSLDFENKKIYIEGIKEYGKFIGNYDFVGSMNRIEPYYIKKPNIS